MGKGDRKTRRGKVANQSYGKARLQKTEKTYVAATAAAKKPAPKKK